MVSVELCIAALQCILVLLFEQGLFHCRAQVDLIAHLLINIIDTVGVGSEPYPFLRDLWHSSMSLAR